MALQQDIEIFQGDDGRQILVRVLDADGSPLELTGLVEWIIGYNANDRPLIYKNSLGLGIAIADQNISKGYFTITIERADTERLDPGIYYHEARLTQSGVATPVLSGSATITASAIG